MLKNISENPFVDLPDAELLLVKHRAVEIIEMEMKKRGLTQAALADLCDLRQPHISEMLSRKLDRFGIDRINRVLAVFGQRIITHYEFGTISDAA